MKILVILLGLCAFLGIVHGRSYAGEDEEDNLLTELIHRMVTVQDSVKTQALKLNAVEAVARAAAADPCFIRNCPPGGK